MVEPSEPGVVYSLSFRTGSISVASSGRLLVVLPKVTHPTEVSTSKTFNNQSECDNSKKVLWGKQRPFILNPRDDDEWLPLLKKKVRLELV